MKKTFFTLAVATIMAGTLITGCELTTEKMENAHDQKQKSMNDDEGSQPMESTMVAVDSVADYQKFKNESEDKITAFEINITQLKVKIAAGEKETQAEYTMKLASLEQKNDEMRKKLKDFNEDEQVNWTKFKAEFNHDMDELSKAFTDLTLKNV